MKVYKLEVIVIDHDGVGDGITDTIENQRYPNHCISPHVVSVEERDIGEWSDAHPLNNTNTFDAEVKRLFGPRVRKVSPIPRFPPHGRR